MIYKKVKKMKIKSLKELIQEEYYQIDENVLINLGYYTEDDSLDSGDTQNILRKVYKKKNTTNNEPSLISFLNGFILSKIWIEKGRVSRLDGKPAEIFYDENGIIDKGWHINGKCINDEISFICLKNNKEKHEINSSDIIYLKDFFKIK